MIALIRRLTSRL